ncbi:MAG TPA: cytochrome P450 [Ktedonobacterales bacterium]
MIERSPSSSTATLSAAELSLYHLLDPNVLANPYPLYARLRREDPVHWDPFLHAWVLTRYNDVVTVFQRFSAARTPTPQQLEALGLGTLAPLARVMVRQMLFLDAPSHTRMRALCSRAFTPHRVERLRSHISDIVDGLIEQCRPRGAMDLIADLANPLPAIVTAELLGLPTADWALLKQWSEDFAEVLGNFQHNPDRAARVLSSLEQMCTYFHDAVRVRRERLESATGNDDDLLSALTKADIAGDRLSDEEIVANVIITMVGGQETTTNLIGNGMLTLLRHPDELARLRDAPELFPSAVEELLRYESPSQHTARLAPEDVELGGKLIRKRQAVIAVMGAANRDPERFADPDRLDLARQDNRHVAFAWGSHYCFGAPLARIEGHLAFQALLHQLPDVRLASGETPRWRDNLGLRGLTSLHLQFEPPGKNYDSAMSNDSATGD